MKDFGDLNADLIVATDDLALAITMYGRSDAEALAAADVNGDGVVDALDIEVIIENMGMTVGMALKHHCLGILPTDPFEAPTPGYGDVCECIGTTAGAAGLEVPNLDDIDPCGSPEPGNPGNPGGPGGPTPPGGGDCGDIEVETPEDCAELADCMKDDAFKDQIDLLEYMRTPEGLDEHFDNIHQRKQALDSQLQQLLLHVLTSIDSTGAVSQFVAELVTNKAGEKLQYYDDAKTQGRESRHMGLALGIAAGGRLGLFCVPLRRQSSPASEQPAAVKSGMCTHPKSHLFRTMSLM